MFQNILQGILLAGLTAMSSFVFTPIAEAQTSACKSVDGNISIQSQFNSLSGSPINLGQFSGIQVLILASRGSMDSAKQMSSPIDLEFQYSKKFRQVLLLDARAMAAFRGAISEQMKKNAPQTSKNTSFNMDFDGKIIQPLINISEKLFTGVDIGKEPVLLILEGKGKVLSAYNKTGDDLQIRQCLREQLKSARN